MNVNGCDECLAYLFKDGVRGYWTLLGACASVGIECGKSAEQLMHECMQEYHNRGHVALERAT